MITKDETKAMENIGWIPVVWPCIHRGILFWMDISSGSWMTTTDTLEICEMRRDDIERYVQDHAKAK